MPISKPAAKPRDPFGNELEVDPFAQQKTPLTPSSKPTDTGGAYKAPEVKAEQPKMDVPQRQQTGAGWSYQGTGYTAPPPPPPPPAVAGAPDMMDFFQYAKLPDAQRAQGYTSQTVLKDAQGPAAAPDYAALVAALGDAKEGPKYQTADGAFRGEAMGDAMEEYARSVLAAPTRVDMPLVQQILGTIDADINRNRRDKSRSIREEMGARGVVGPESSPWAGSLAEMETDLSEQEAARKTALAQWAAETLSADRANTANIGLGVGNFQRGLGQDRAAEGQFQWNADRLTGRDLESDRQARVGFDLNAAQLGEDADRYRTDFNEDAYRYRTNFAEDADRFGWETNRLVGRDYEQDIATRAGLNLQAAGMTDSGQMSRANYGLNAAGLAEQANIARASLAQQQAAAAAANEIARNQLSQNESQFGRNQSQDDFWNEMEMYYKLYGTLPS